MRDALTTVEKAYDEVTKYKLAASYRNELVSIVRRSPMQVGTLQLNKCGLSASVHQSFKPVKLVGDFVESGSSG